jgi:hypothetical protein
MGTHPQGTWFEAAWGDAGVRLCVGPGTRAAAHAAAAAILLHGVEALLSPLDDWSGAELDWRWVDAPAPDGQGVHASARWHGGSTAHECVVSWPWTALRSLPPPPADLAARLEWPMVDAVLVLAELQIDRAELELLEPGGAVLVPQSLQPPWQGLLRGAEAAPQASVAVDLSIPWRPRLATAPALPGAVVADPARAACELRLDLPLGVSAQRLAGWRREGDAGEIVRLDEGVLRATLCQGGRTMAGGRMMPWGDGWALAVETVLP